MKFRSHESPSLQSIMTNFPNFKILLFDEMPTLLCVIKIKDNFFKSYRGKPHYLLFRMIQNVFKSDNYK